MSISKQSENLTMAHHPPSGEVGHQTKFVPYHLFMLQTCHLGILMFVYNPNMPLWPSRFPFIYGPWQVGSFRLFTHRLCYLGPLENGPFFGPAILAGTSFPLEDTTMILVMQYFPDCFCYDSPSKQLSLGGGIP